MSGGPRPEWIRGWLSPLVREPFGDGYGYETHRRLRQLDIKAKSISVPVERVIPRLG